MVNQGSLGDMAQNRAILEQVAKAVVAEYENEHPQQKEATLPATLKWLGLVAGAIISMGAGAMAIWLVGSVSSMQVTLARMDERLLLQAKGQDSKFDELDRRLTVIEHSTNGPK